MKKADRNWKIVREYCSKINTYLVEHPEAVLFYEGAHVPFGITLDENNKKASVRHGNCMFLLFDGNPNFDEGAYSEIKEILNEIKKKLEVYKKVNIR